MASRKIKPEELRELQPLFGDVATNAGEHVLALDGICGSRPPSQPGSGAPAGWRITDSTDGGAMTILEALSDPNLFGALPSFHDLKTWSAWRAFLAAVYGLPMAEAELEVFRAHTGRATPRPGGYGEAVAIVGRQSGKSQVAAALATFEAIRAPREPGRGGCGRR
jgi:hypothetical protein